MRENGGGMWEERLCFWPIRAEIDSQNHLAFSLHNFSSETEQPFQHPSNTCSSV